VTLAPFTLHVSSSAVLVACSLLGVACHPQQQPAQAAPVEAASVSQQEVEVTENRLPDYGEFRLKPEPEVACSVADKIDVNLGHSPEAFVKAAHCQVAGKPAPAEVIAEWAEKLRSHPLTRRIDVVRSLCSDNKRASCELVYSDPWQEQVELQGAPERAVKREIGAVMMFFFHCPDDTNCKMNWANTHAPGMDKPHPLLGFGDKKDGYYVADHPGFWRRELLDAQWAGLSFVMPNTYGPDIEEGQLKHLMTALESLEDPPKIAMFDDTWAWGEPWFSEFWTQKPNLKDTDKTAKLLYEAKWRPFFKQVDKKYWYRFKGQPFIYFYNSGKLEPRNHTAPVIAKMKALFKKDFGEEPFVSVDTAYFEDQRMKETADSEFKWFTFQTPGKRSRSTLKGHTIDHAMVKWDPVGRDRPEGIAKPGDLLVKDGKLLQKVLDESKDAELLVLATWNDLGEGTGVNRNYDYYAHGQWLAPNHFMKMIRDSQSGK
jgi:hypothetical protein